MLLIRCMLDFAHLSVTKFRVESERRKQHFFRSGFAFVFVSFLGQAWVTIFASLGKSQEDT